MPDGRSARLLEGAVSSARGRGLDQPGSSQKGEHQTDNCADELLPAESNSTTREVELIGKDGANREEDPHDQHERGQNADGGRRGSLRFHGFTYATPEA